MKRTLLLVAVAILGVLATTDIAARLLALPQYTPDDAYINRTNGLSPDGSTVFLQAGDGDAYMWRVDDGLIRIGHLPGGDNPTAHINASSRDGSVLVGESTSSAAPNGWDVFRWERGRMRSIGVGWGKDVSGDGRIIVGDFGAPAGRNPIMWRRGRGIYQPFVLPEEIVGINATAVSRDGLQVVGEVYYGPFTGGFKGFYWSQRDGLHILDGRPQDISGDGRVIVGVRYDGPEEGLRWRRIGSGSRTRFSEQSLGDGGAWATSGDGRVVLGGGYIWDTSRGRQITEEYLSRVLDVETAGWENMRAQGISDDGRVLAGFGWYQHGYRNWYADDREQVVLPLTTSWAQTGVDKQYVLNVSIAPRGTPPCEQDAYNFDVVMRGASRGWSRGRIYDGEFVAGCTSVAVAQLIIYHMRNGYEDGWLDYLLEDVAVYPRPWSLRGRRPACVHQGFATQNWYPDTLETRADAGAYDVVNLLWHVGLGLDLDYRFRYLFERSGTGLTRYPSNPPSDMTYPDKLANLLEDRFRFQVSAAINEVARLNDVAEVIIDSIDEGNPVILFLWSPGAGHNALIHGYRRAADSRQEDYDFLINMGWGGAHNDWYSGQGEFTAGQRKWRQFGVVVAKPVQ